jgi:hypothetical protein
MVTASARWSSPWPILNAGFEGQGEASQTLHWEEVKTALRWSALPSQQSALAGYARTLRALDEFLRLEDNWDSYDALRISPVAAEVASEILVWVASSLGFYPRTLPVADVVPLPDGGVQLEWASARALLEVEIGPSGDISYLLTDRSRVGEPPKAGQITETELVALFAAL